MRDVTDNVTGELPGVEQKRGRGRPRKAHAMTNAERQAAYRARRKQQQGAADRSVTVTKKISEVDAYDDCQEQVDALRFELAQVVKAHNKMAERLGEVVREKEIALREMRAKRDKAEELSRELFQLKKKLLQEKSVTSGNDNSLMFADLVSVVGQACAVNRPERWRSELLESVSLQRLVNFMPLGSFQALCSAIQGGAADGDKKTVTRKRVTKKSV
jgi:hypothetical protein